MAVTRAGGAGALTALLPELGGSHGGDGRMCVIGYVFRELQFVGNRILQIERLFGFREFTARIVATSNCCSVMRRMWTMVFGKYDDAVYRTVIQWIGWGRQDAASIV